MTTRTRTRTTQKYYAVTGDDGLRPVVWGVGRTERAALSDSRRWMDPMDPPGTRVVEISAEQARRIHAGEVCCDALGIAVQS